MGFVGAFFLLVLVLSTTELFLLIRVAAAIGFFPAMGLCILTGVIGGLLVRHQGLATIRAIQREFATGGLPADELVGGALLLLAGALLCVPGFITDVVGFALLIPPLRRAAAGFIRNRIFLRFSLCTWENREEESGAEPPGASTPPWDDRRIIDAEFKEKPRGDD